MISSARIQFRLICLLSLLWAVAPVLIPQDRDTDLQAVYSWFLTHATDGDRLHLVAPETQPTSYPDQHCLDVPPSHAADLREIRADFERRKNATRLIPNPLLTSKRYVILDPSVAKEVIMTSPALSQSPIIRERYPGTNHLLIFSDVYFNRRRTVALVQVDHWCGGLCGESSWVAFEKGNDGVWQRRRWARCIAIARAIEGIRGAGARSRDRQGADSGIRKPPPPQSVDRDGSGRLSRITRCHFLTAPTAEQAATA